jgi:hypothetical protein
VFSPGDVEYAIKNGMKSYVGFHKSRSISYFDPQVMVGSRLKVEGKEFKGVSEGRRLCSKCF